MQLAVFLSNPKLATKIFRRQDLHNECTCVEGVSSPPKAWSWQFAYMCHQLLGSEPFVGKGWKRGVDQSHLKINNSLNTFELLLTSAHFAVQETERHGESVASCSEARPTCNVIVALHVIVSLTSLASMILQANCSKLCWNTMFSLRTLLPYNRSCTNAHGLVKVPPPPSPMTTAPAPVLRAVVVPVLDYSL